MYFRLFFLFTFFITSISVAAQNPPSHVSSGGRAYFPRSLVEMRDIAELIAYQLRRQYVIGFEPPVRDNKMHSINVKVMPLKTPAKAIRMFVFHSKAYYSH